MTSFHFSSLEKVSGMLPSHIKSANQLFQNFETKVESQKKKSGRKELLSQRDEEFCKNKIVTGQMQHATDVKKALEKNFGINVSTNTVKRSLHRSGLKVGKKKKKPALSPKNRKMRLEFAKQQWTVEDWKRVVFSDETKINRFNSDGMNWCWFRDTKNLESRTVSQTQKFGGGSVMVWSCFSCEGIGFLCKIDGIMDSNLFLQILQGELKDSIKYFKFRRGMHFSARQRSKAQVKVGSRMAQKTKVFCSRLASTIPRPQSNRKLVGHLEKKAQSVFRTTKRNSSALGEN